VNDGDVFELDLDCRNELAAAATDAFKVARSLKRAGSPRSAAAIIRLVEAARDALARKRTA
jgi:hypothetical protein